MFSETAFGAGPGLERIVLFAAQQEPVPLEEPQGRTAGPALPRLHHRRIGGHAIRGRRAQNPAPLSVS